MTSTSEESPPPQRKRGRPLGSKNSAPRRVMPTGSMYDKRYRYHTVSAVQRMLMRTQRLAAHARQFNSAMSQQDHQDFYMGGMNAIAAKFWDLARTEKSDPNELRIYADLLLKHFEQKIKSDKIKIMGRHLELLEQKARALESAVRNARSPAELGAYVREVLFPQQNGHKPTKIETPLLENGVAP